MTNCECNNWGLTIALSILTSTMAILLASNGSGLGLGLGSTINDGMVYLANGELYYISHPFELLTAPWFWVLLGFVAIWKHVDIVFFFIGVVDYFRKEKPADKTHEEIL